jgi:iron(III) transport system substrate-binding protein
LKTILRALLPLLLIGLSHPSALHAGEASWQAEWEKTLAGAKREGQLTVYGQSGDERIYVEAFQKAFPFVRVAYTSGRLSELVSRIMTERRAGKYLADLAIGGTTIPLENLKPAGVLEPIRPLLILPEVLDGAAWFQKKLWFGDSENRYVVIWRGSVVPLFSVNTKLASAADFKTYADLLNPKWKGKIVALDPRRPGNAANLTVFVYATPSLGRNFLKRLFGEMDVTFSNDRYQVVDWLARGKFAVNLFSPVSREDMKAGLPLVDVKVDGPAPLGAGAASASLLNRAPHPNAAKLFLNWLLSREGQIAYQKASENNSLRADIPKKGIVEPGEVPQEGREYFFYSLEENDKKQRDPEFRQFLNEIIPRN